MNPDFLKTKNETIIKELRAVAEYHEAEAVKYRSVISRLRESSTPPHPPLTTPPPLQLPPLIPLHVTGELPATKGAREGQITTIKGGVEFLLKKYKAGLTRQQVVELILSEIEYQTDSHQKQFANNMYHSGILTLIRAGVVVATGGRKNPIYKHVDNLAED